MCALISNQGKDTIPSATNFIYSAKVPQHLLTSAAVNHKLYNHMMGYLSDRLQYKFVEGAVWCIANITYEGQHGNQSRQLTVRIAFPV
jgi:hypothetical protein